MTPFDPEARFRMGQFRSQLQWNASAIEAALHNMRIGCVDSARTILETALRTSKATLEDAAAPVVQAAE